MIQIGARRIGPGERVFVIAEAGINHNGDPQLAKELIDVAADAGADAVKFQTFRAEEVVTSDAPKARYQMTATDPEASHLDMLRRYELSPEAHWELLERCHARGILFL